MTTQRVLFLSCILLATTAPACVEQSPELTQAEREQVREFISSEPPSPQHELDIRFENRVQLVGYDISPEAIAPGEEFTITWYWHCDRRLEAGWQIFTHLADGAGQNRQNEDQNGVVRTIYQPGRWQEGQYIRDVQRITIPRDWGSDRVVFYMGVWRGDRRLAITRGAHDSEDRARAATIDVRGGPQAAADVEAAPAAAPVPLPQMRADHTSAAITIDGRLDEPDWQRTQRSSAFVNTMDASPAELAASSRVLWDEQRLYVAFEVEDDFLRSDLRGRDAHLWEQDAVEIMIDPDGDGSNYFELQVSPTGNMFDTRYDSRRVPGPIGHADWNADMSARVAAEGRANDDTDDTRYTVELSIPWGSFTDAAGAALAAPPAGSTWRANFYVMDIRRDGGQRSCGWSPTLVGDFHVPNRFGRVTFAPAPVAAAEPEAVPTAVARPTASPIGLVPQIRVAPSVARELRRDLEPPIARELRPTAPTVRPPGE